MMVLWADHISLQVYTPRGVMRATAEAVAAKYGLTLSDMTGPERRRSVAHPRQEAMAEVYALGRFSLPQIARFFGGRDHTTILYGVRAHHARKARSDDQ